MYSATPNDFFKNPALAFAHRGSRGCPKPRLLVKLSVRLLDRLHRVTPINLFHDLLSPADRIGNGANRGRNSCSAVVLRQSACCQN